MFGWVHESFRQLMTRKYGKEIWTKILEIAKFEEGTENEIGKYYKDEESFRIVSAMGSVIGIPVEEVWEAYGGFLIQFTMETGWDELLRALSPDLEGFLDALDALHYFIDHVVYRTKLKGPAFRCEPQSDGSLILHYYSRRCGLYPIVKGVIREVARRIYDTEVIMKVQERKQEHMDTMMTEHVIFVINQVENGISISRPIACRSSSGSFVSSSESVNCFSNSFRIDDFCVAFPHHFCFDQKLRIEHVGVYIRRSFPTIVHGETNLEDILKLVHPEIPLSFDSIITFRNSLFVFQIRDEGSSRSGSKPSSVRSDEAHVPVTLKGSMHSVGNNNFLVFMCSFNVTTVNEMVERNLFLSDIQRHDSTRDLIMLNQSRMSQVELNRRLEETTRNLKCLANALKAEKQRTEGLLCELMPPSVAESLRRGATVDAAEFSEATVLFTDIVTFTNICSFCTPYDVIKLLNDLYQRFDRIVGLHDVYKVETIGDAYMIVGGVPKECQNHAEKILNVAIGFLMESRFVTNPTNDLAISIRIGVHSGPVVAGVVGVKMPRYCLFGDTIHLANRMESLGMPSKIHVSETAKALAIRNNPSFLFTERGAIKIKGKEKLRTYFLERNDRQSVWEICGRVREMDQSIDGYQELHRERSTEEEGRKKNGGKIHRQRDYEEEENGEKRSTMVVEIGEEQPEEEGERDKREKREKKEDETNGREMRQKQTTKVHSKACALL
ncbi:hypothetical protein niasHS_014867 [Heterodera schachtii]|uniref:guanylate cyclase n=1 Tax=Heterodera schachtii TaxID=97005 RepID=A0ABD2IMN2_HETSC